MGKKFTPNYEGSAKGKIATLVIVGSSLKYINEVKSYLWKTFRISQEKINGHGSIATTIIIKLSELNVESLDRIEAEYKLKFPEGISKRSTSVVVREKSLESPIDEKVITFDSQKSTPVENTKNGRMSVSKFLNSLFEFEEGLTNPVTKNMKNQSVKNYFHYDSQLVDGYSTMHCKDVATATLIEGALTWYLQNKRWVSRLSEEETDVSFIITNDNKREKMAGLLYCPPPSCNSSRSEIEQRLRRVCKGAIPIIDHSYSFLSPGLVKVDYSKKNTASKVLGFITEMGWNAELQDDYTFILNTSKSLTGTFQSNNSEIKEGIIETKPEEQMEEIPPVVEVVSSNKVESQPEPELETAYVPNFVHSISSPTEALLELNRLYSDQKLFKALSLETREQIVSTLEKIWIREHAEEYARKLLSFFK